LACEEESIVFVSERAQHESWPTGFGIARRHDVTSLLRACLFCGA